MAQAQRDLSDGEYLSDGARYNTACFLAQQAAEKAVVGYLFYRGAEDVWGHSLSDLCEDAAVFDQTFQVLRSSASLFDKHFYMTRYPRFLPGGIPADAFDEKEAKHAIGLAREVIAFVRDRVEASDEPVKG